MSEVIEKPKAATKPKLVTIHIPKTKDEASDVQVAVQFKPYLIRRGMNVEVPAEVVEALSLAVETRYEEEIIDGKPTMVAREVPSVNFSIIG
jgi:hypothetical protein